MMSKKYRMIEFFLLFIVLPVSLAIPFDFRIKSASILAAFGYLLIVLFKKTDVRFRFKKGIAWGAFFKRITVQFIMIAVVTTFFVWWLQPYSLFCVPLNKPKLFLVILFVYTFLSVWPQEVIYRSFYFARYMDLFPSRKLLIFVNAIVFMLAHIFFKNALVLVLTFIGGLLFAYTFLHTRSTTLVSIEHALYGNWLFTVGMGEMLAFPGQEGCG